MKISDARPLRAVQEKHTRCAAELPVAPQRLSGQSGDPQGYGKIEMSHSGWGPGSARKRSEPERSPAPSQGGLAARAAPSPWVRCCGLIRRLRRFLCFSLVTGLLRAGWWLSPFQLFVWIRQPQRAVQELTHKDLFWAKPSRWCFAPSWKIRLHHDTVQSFCTTRCSW